MSIIEEKQERERLLASVKKEVKQLMEESVTKKFVHEDSSCIISLCATIEQCLLHGLKRRSVGLFKASTTMALLEKLGKNFEPAQIVVKLCNDYDDKYCNQNLISKKFFPNQTISDKDSNLRGRNFAPTFYKGSNCYKFLWIRLALLNKLLNKIIDHILLNSSNYYTSFALVADPVDGPIFSSLLVGPCALEFTKLKTCDHLWSDPNADELIQRYRMHNLCNQGTSVNTSSTSSSNNNSTSNTTSVSSSTPNTSNNSNTFYYQIQSPKVKLGLNASIILKRNASSGNSNLSMDESNVSSITSPISIASSSNYTNGMKTPMTPGPLNTTIPTSTISQSPNSSINLNSTTNNAKEYVESIHQNSKSQLIYGKNYVIVYPKEEMDGLPGYLSLHSNQSNILTLKWTPNQLMNGSVDESQSIKSKNVYWDYAINVDITNIVYLHCHQHAKRGATIVLVGQDGIQYPPICFPKGSHCLQFLTCLENGLAPYSSLDPPLWNEEGKGKVLPKIKNMKNNEQQQEAQEAQFKKQKISVDSNNNELKEDDYEAKDVVFRIVTNSKESINGQDNNQKSFFNNLFNNNNPISSIFNSLSSTPNETTTTTTTTTQTKHSTSSTSSAQSDGKCPPTPSPSIKSGSSISSLKTSTVIGTKELVQQQVTPTTILSDISNNKTKLCKSISVRSSMKQLCDTMKKQIVSRAFYGWLAHCRHLKTIRLHLVGLVHLKNNHELENTEIKEFDNIKILTNELWSQWLIDESVNKISLKKYENLINEIIYLNGCKNNELRAKIWPFLLKHYRFDMTPEERFEKDVETKTNYSNLILEWKIFEDFIRIRDQQQKSVALENLSSASASALPPTPSIVSNDNKTSTCIIQNINKEKLLDKDLNLTPIITANNNQKLVQIKNSNLLRNDLILLRKDSSLSNDVFIEDMCHSPLNNTNKDEINFNRIPEETLSQSQSKTTIDNDSNRQHSRQSSTSCSFVSFNDDIIHNGNDEYEDVNDTAINNVLDQSLIEQETISSPKDEEINNNKINDKTLDNKELINNFATNIHRIDKDVTRCDRNYYYFASNDNLQKLRNIMYTYVWETLDVGYIQGMCDLVAPFLVIFNDEAMAYSCFKQLMNRMAANFPHGNGMDKHFANMRSLIQILDSTLFEHMHQRGDYTHFYFSYRWFLLDFKRELVYEDIFTIWETIWTAHNVCSEHFSLFIALALVEAYRDIIIDNNMDFTDIIKFFNEMAEKHNTQHVLNLARNLVKQLQDLISNKDEF